MGSSRVRIYQLSRDLNLKNKEILAVCHQLKIPARSHASTVTPTEAGQIRIALNRSVRPAVASAAEPSPTPPCPVQSPLTALQEPQLFLNPELSWLKFNQRVFQQAQDAGIPLLERLKFMAICCTSLDEYFMVRIATLKQQSAIGKAPLSLDGRTPQNQLERVEQELQQLLREQHRYFASELRPQLAAAGLVLLDYRQLDLSQQRFSQEYFATQIFPILTPLALGPGHPFPYISNLSLNLAVVVQDPATGREQFARVKVPDRLPRFIALPSPSPGVQWQAVPLEQVIAHNLAALFPNMKIQAAYPFRVTRNANLVLEEAEPEDLLQAIAEELRKRRFGAIVRMEIQAGTPSFVRQTLVQQLQLEDRQVYEVEGLLCLKDLIALGQLPFPQLKDPDWSPGVPLAVRSLPPLALPATRLETWPHPTPAIASPGGDMFALLRQGDLLLHHPYDAFEATVQRFLTEAAQDPQVVAIKITLYRTGSDGASLESPIVNSLILAAEQGKQVVAVVELKARFDEENNIFWARKLEKAGVHVVYGLLGLKTHAKVILVVRREKTGIRRYVHIGTGNYHPRTARLYTDLSLLSSRQALGEDLTNLFNYLTGYSRQQTYRRLLVAPVNLRDRCLELIRREIASHRPDSPGRIILKMNALSDPEMIAALYAASQAGVQIDLIIRGICCLRPGLKGISDQIRVISLIGSLLEHDRIFYFHHQGQPEVWIGSADWRSWNLDRQVEVLVPLEDPSLIQQVQALLELILTDNRQTWELTASGEYIQRLPIADQPERATQKILIGQILAESTRG